MGLAPGTRIGSYEIVAPLGAGGMGEVYRARDTRLKRDVALKLLPEAFAADPERLARFQREAEVLGSLNHPLIAHVYGIEDAAAAAGTGITRAIAMELVEGEDLAQRLARGALPFDEALPIARQIAEALEAAHEQGIIHRDLKPANIKLRSDGTVKVLDFGLAKAVEGSGTHQGSSAALLNSPTITSPAMTLQGMILGTAAYMSPEQAKGRVADKRSDLWAFGCVLYEMLSGKRPFDGEDVSDTLALVLQGTPDWSALPAGLPTAVRRLIQQCLERDRRQRVASASTALYALADRSLAEPVAAGTTAASEAAVTAAVASAVTNTRRQVMRSLVMPIAAVAILGLALAAYLATRQPNAVPVPVSRVVVNFPGAPTTGRGSIAISPDGQRIAYVSSFRLFVRQLSDYAPRELVGGSAMNIVETVFSPDGQSIGFYAGGALHRTAVAGGAVTPICKVEATFGLSWDASGLIAGQGPKGIVRCQENGGSAETLVTVEDGFEAHGPRVLPDGKTLIYSLARTADGQNRWDKAQIVAETPGGRDRRVLITGGADARYVASGHLVYALGGVLLAAPFDATRVVVTGQAVPVIEGVRRALTGVTGVAQFDASANGALLYLPGPVRTTRDRVIATSSRDGGVARLQSAPGPFDHVRASRDGSRLVIGSRDGDEAVIWIYPIDGRSPMRRVPLKGRNSAPIWSPEGARLAVQSDAEGDRAIFITREDGTGFERVTKPAAGEAHTPESWSPDGRFLTFSSERDGHYALRVVELKTKTEAPFAGIESEEPINSVFSPDGKWIAYTVGVKGAVQVATRGVYVQPFPATGAVHALPRLGLDFHPLWSRDGREILWVPSATSGQHAVVAVSYSPTGPVFSAPMTFPARVTSRQISGDARSFDILPDGRLVGTIDPNDNGSSDVDDGGIRLVLNWFEELKRSVPAR